MELPVVSLGSCEGAAGGANPSNSAAIRSRKHQRPRGRVAKMEASTGISKSHVIIWIAKG